MLSELLDGSIALPHWDSSGYCVHVREAQWAAIYHFSMRKREKYANDALAWVRYVLVPS